MKSFFATYIEPLSQITFRVQPLPEYIGNTHGKVEKKKSYPKKAIHQQLTYWAESDREPPPSVKEVAAQIGCDRKLLYNIAPELCKVISQKYYSYVKNRSKERLEKVKRQVKNAVTTLNENGIYPSARKVEEFLEMPGVIREQAIQLYWNQELEKLDHGQLK